MAYDRLRVAATYRRSLRMLELCKKLAALYQQAPARPGDIMHERDLYYLAALDRRALAHMLACRAIRRANAGRRNTQREWLVSRLCGIWLDNFCGRDLTVTVPGDGGPPRGPLIEFLQTAMRVVMFVKPSADTLRDAIARERAERENAKQLRLQLSSRRQWGFDARK